MPTILLTDLISRLRPRLSGSLPGLESQLKMAPSHRAAALVQAGAEDARKAAVLIVLEGDVQPQIVLTERRHDLPSHPGQISFPGGSQEPDEPLLTTALREASEEVGLNKSDVEVLGGLSPLFVPPSNYLVHPFVAFSFDSLELSPADGEVSSIIRAPMSDFLDSSNRRTENRERYGRVVPVPLFEVVGHKVWGATAMMMAELIDLLRD